jgi:hypothetical protein
MRAKRFIMRAALLGRLEESKHKGIFVYVNAKPDWSTLKRFCRVSDLFVVCVGVMGRERFCRGFEKQAGDQLDRWESVPAGLANQPGFRILTGPSAPDWTLFAVCWAKGGPSALLVIGGDEDRFYNAFFTDLEKAPTYLYLGKSEALPGDLCAVLRGDKRLEPAFVIARSGERAWPWKLR